MGRDHHAGQPEQRALGRRLPREDVDRGAAQPAALQRLDEGVDVEHVAPRGVDHAGPGAHRGEGRAADQAPRLRRGGQVERDEVGAAVQVLRRVGALDAELAEAAVGHEGVVGDHAHAEPLGPRGHELADAPEAEHPEGLARHLDAREARPLPPAGHQARVGLGDVPGLRHEQGDGVLGGGDRVGLRRVADHNAAPGRGRHVDVVHPRARAPDDAKPPRPLDEPGVDLGGAPHHQAVVVADARLEASSRVQPTPRSTAKRSRSRSTPVSASGSETSTRRSAGPRLAAPISRAPGRRPRSRAGRPARRPPARPAGPAPPGRSGERAGGDEDVRPRAPAAVADPHHPARQLALAAGHLDAVPRLHQARDCLPLHPLGVPEGRADVGLGIVRAERREPQGGDGGPARPAEGAVALVDRARPSASISRSASCSCTTRVTGGVKAVRRGSWFCRARVRAQLRA